MDENNEVQCFAAKLFFRREPTASGAGGGRQRVRRMSTGASYCLRQGAGGLFAREKEAAGVGGKSCWLLATGCQLICRVDEVTGCENESDKGMLVVKSHQLLTGRRKAFVTAARS